MRYIHRFLCLALCLFACAFCARAVAEESARVEMLRISRQQISLRTGEQAQLYVTDISPETATDASLAWVSDDEDIARVDVSGCVTGVRAGSTRVRLVAKDGGGAQAYCAVIVEQPALRVTLEKSAVSVERGGMLALTAHVLPEDATDKTISWESDKPYVVSVNENGVVTGKERGQAVITARSASGDAVSAQCIVTVTRATLTSIQVLPSAVTLGAGQTAALVCALTPAEAEYAVSYESADKAVATVDENGVVKAIKRGDTTITLRASDKTATCAVHVKKAPDKITLQETLVTLGVGETLTLHASVPDDTLGSWTFSVGKESVATVDENGLMTAVGKGETTVTAKTHNGKNAYCRVQVKNPPEALTFSQEEYVVREGEKIDLSVSPDRGAGGTVVVAASDVGIARVREDGTVEGLSAGVTTLTATSYNGVTARAALTVTPAPRGIACEDMTLGVGQTAAISYTLSPEGAQSEVVAASSDEKCVRVKSDGTLRAAREGEAEITLTASGVACVFRVRVLPAPDEIALSDTELTLRPGQTRRVEVTLPEGTLSGWTYKTGKRRVATVDENGVVTAVGKGETYLTVTTDNGRVASCHIVVTD